MFDFGWGVNRAECLASSCLQNVFFFFNFVFREEARARQPPPPPNSPLGAPLFYSHLWSGKSTLYSPVVPPGLIFSNSTFCPHSVFMCFVWIWEQTAIISLHSTDWLVFITEMECVYCAVRSTFYVLPSQCIYVFCVDLRTNSDYFSVQHWLVGFYNWDGVCLPRGTFYILRSANTVYLCVLCGPENKQRLFHCTALTGWFL